MKSRQKRVSQPKPSEAAIVLKPESDPIRVKWLDEMVRGYLDGRDPDSPEPSANRSCSYAHGFANGRDDCARAPRTTAAVLRVLAEKAINDDIAATTRQS